MGVGLLAQYKKKLKRKQLMMKMFIAWMKCFSFVTTIEVLKYYFTMQKYNLQKISSKKNPKSFKIL